MWKGSICVIAIIYLFFHLTISKAEAYVNNIIWKNVSNGIRDLDLQMVAVDPGNPDIAFITSSHVIYKTQNGGKIWEEVFSLRSTGDTINSIVIDPLNTKIIYAGTGDGLYRSKNQGISWEKIFKGIGELKNSILSIAINPLDSKKLFIGTKAGIFLTDDGGSTWKKGRGVSSSAMVSFISIDPYEPDIIYAVSGHGIYKSVDGGITWKRIFEPYIPQDTAKEDYNLSDQNEIIEKQQIDSTIKCIAIHPIDTNIVYIGTSNGLLVTKDGGVTWKKLSTSGLISHDIKHLVLSSTDPDGVYVATNRGVFRYSTTSKTWKELYRGLLSLDIRFLSLIPGNQDNLLTLWATTKRGVFKTTYITHNTSDSKREKTEKILSIFAREPSIQEIQQAAIRYAEVHPEKIKSWRRAAQRKAWLPDLRIEYERNKDWQSSGYFYGGVYRDDDITWGKDWSWSISLTWELGDLIWNNDQTSIDTRSRLMVQLRDDILNEVTRLYFERRRLQIELLLSPPKDLKERIEKELRLKELTADIDALTGFYLSKRLGQKKMDE